MTNKAYSAILKLILQAAQKARAIGIANLLQPGLVKEMIIADILGHELILTKRDADAHCIHNPNEKYEYLSCVEGGSGQIDRMFKSPADRRATSLIRITRNAKFYFAVFYKNNQTKCKIIYEVEPSVVLSETERQLDKSANDISHVGFPISWVSKNGKIVFQDGKP